MTRGECSVKRFAVRYALARHYAPGRAALLSLLLTSVVCLRVPDRLVAPTLWAEDGTIFLKGAHDLGAAAILQPYNGYHNLFPRLVSFIAVHLPLLWAPRVLVFGAILGLAFFAYRVLRWRVPVRGKLLLAGAPALVPHSGEVFLSITNIQWLLGLVLVVIATEPTWARTSRWLFDLGTIVVVGLTGPFAAVFAPLAAARAFVRRRDLRERIALSAFASAALVQVGCYLAGGRPPTPQAPPLGEWLPLAVANFASALLIDPRSGLSLDLGLFLAAGMLVLLLWLTTGLAGQSRWASLLVLAALALVTVACVLPVRHVARAFHPLAAARYTFVPYVLVLWLVVMAMNVRRRWPRIAAAVLLLLIARSGFATFRAEPRAPLDWATFVAAYEQGRAARVAIAPTGWVLELSRNAQHQ